ncbi:MAG: hypothetical protein M3155_04090 [Actinomycetota bacterium]|nr:hypothetical protein [Actinomycetota bacterium]
MWGEGRRRTAGVVALTAVAVAGVAAGSAEGRPLKRVEASRLAVKAAKRLARHRSGETHVHYSRLRCVRRSAQQFRCYTTVSGATLCAPSETACDGPAPFAIPYAITLSLRPAPGARVRVIVRQA